MSYCANLTIAAPSTVSISLGSTITVSPASPVAGSAVTLTGTLTNSGNTAGTTTVSAAMGTPSVVMTTQSYTVSPGTPVTASLTFTVPAGTTAGSYQFCLTST